MAIPLVFYFQIHFFHYYDQIILLSRLLMLRRFNSCHFSILPADIRIYGGGKYAYAPYKPIRRFYY